MMQEVWKTKLEILFNFPYLWLDMFNSAHLHLRYCTFSPADQNRSAKKLPVWLLYVLVKRMRSGSLGRLSIPICNVMLYQLFRFCMSSQQSHHLKHQWANSITLSDTDVVNHWILSPWFPPPIHLFQSLSRLVSRLWAFSVLHLEVIFINTQEGVSWLWWWYSYLLQSDLG